MFLSQIFEGSVKDIAISKQDYDKMTPQQFYGQHGITRDEWMSQHKRLLTKPRKTRAPAVKNYEAWGYQYNARDQRELWKKNFASEQAAKIYADRHNIDLMGVKKIA